MSMISSYIIRIGDYNKISFVGGHFLSLHLHSNNDNFLSRRQQLFCNQIYIKVYCSAIFYAHNYSYKREIFSYEKKYLMMMMDMGWCWLPNNNRKSLSAITIITHWLLSHWSSKLHFFVQFWLLASTMFMIARQ